MGNNREFLDVFNNIESFLKKSLDTTYNSSFYSMLEKVSSQNKIVNYYKEELNTLRELRNFIVHGDIASPLAIVSNETVARIKEIDRALNSPKKIREVFLPNVTALKESDKLTTALRIIKEKKFSQFPVINKDGFNGLVTENGITRWLSNNIEKDQISIKDTCICDVMIDDEEVDSYMYLYAYDSLYDVIKAFDKRRLTHRRSFVIIVLKRKTDQVLLDDIYTILTPWDLNKVYKSLGLNKWFNKWLYFYM